MKKFLRIIAAVVLGLLLFIVGLEGYLRLVTYDEDDSLKAFNVPIYESSLALSWKNSSGTFDRYFGEDLLINGFGYRDNEPVAEDEVILMLGDDFTFGRQMAQSKIFPSLLDEKIEGIDFWNSAVNRYSIAQYATYLNQNMFVSVPENKPKMVVMNLFVGDDLSALKNFKLLTEKDGLPELLVHKNLFVDESGYLRLVDFDPIISLAWKEVERQILRKVEESGRSDWSEFLPVSHELRDPEVDVYLAQARRYLNEINSKLEAQGVEFLVVMIPMDVQISRQYWRRYDNVPFDSHIMNDNLPQRGLTAFMDNEGIDYLDLLPVFRDDEQKSDLYLKGSIYLSEYGHLLVADEISAKVGEMLSRQQ